MDGTVIVVTRCGLGTTRPEDDAFGVTMLEKFLHTLEKAPQKPRAICFYTEGVRCVIEGSPVLLGLQLLAGMGVRLVVCGTCLDNYDLADQVAVGEVGGMDAIVALMAGATNVVTV
ncbi:MAG: DsrE family protein [Planctomycetota bacterium]|jgi:intracellular sulfur oxidation DsrE/DsrF family protein